MKKPQPHGGPRDMPLRRSYLLLDDGKCLSTDWEQWSNMSPASQVRPLVATGRRLYIGLFGKEVGERGEDFDGDGDRVAREREARERKWQSLPRELKLAIRRVHVNLGHASVRISKASEVAIKACRLFHDCARLQEPKRPRPSKLLLANEFNVLIGLDIFQEKDAQGQQWTLLNVICTRDDLPGGGLLADTFANPTSQTVLEAWSTHWTSWAGYPERGVMTDRAKYFLADFAEDVAEHGCHFDTAKASPWQLGQVERHGILWKAAFRRLVWSQQVVGRAEVQLAVSSVTQAKNSLSRRGGFSPAQWVLGGTFDYPPPWQMRPRWSASVPGHGGDTGNKVSVEVCSSRGIRLLQQRLSVETGRAAEGEAQSRTVPSGQLRLLLRRCSPRSWPCLLARRCQSGGTRRIVVSGWK